MQKKLIVLAIASLAASASAFADSTVNVYGVADATVVNAQGTGLVGGTTALSGGLAASRVGVKAVEPLDNGLTAVAVVEFGLDIETNQSSSLVATTGYQSKLGKTSTSSANNMVARQQMLALAGSFGTVATGYLQTAGYDFGAKYNNVAGSLVSPLGNIVKGQGFYIGDQGTANRAQRAIAYISPDMGGLKVAVNYAAALTDYGDVANSTTATGSNISATLVSVNYDAGPLSVGGVYLASNADVYTANITEYSLGASYDLGVAKLMATYQSQSAPNASSTNNANASNTAFSVGATVPLASGALALSYAASTINTIASSALSQNANGYTVAFLQPMSKTTTAYLAYSAMNQGNGTTAVTVGNNLLGTTAGGNSSVVALGLNKKF